MKQNAATSFVKRFGAVLHVIFAFITFLGIGFMYLNSNYGRGLEWLKNESFDSLRILIRRYSLISQVFSTISIIRNFLRPTVPSTTPK